VCILIRITPFRSCILFYVISLPLFINSVFIAPGERLIRLVIKPAEFLLHCLKERVSALCVKSSLLSQACTPDMLDISENAREHVLHSLYPHRASSPPPPHLPFTRSTLKLPQQLIFAACSCSTPIFFFLPQDCFKIRGFQPTARGCMRPVVVLCVSRVYF
jgi:hypothetical protein